MSLNASAQRIFTVAKKGYSSSLSGAHEFLLLKKNTERNPIYVDANTQRIVGRL